MKLRKKIITVFIFLLCGFFSEAGAAHAVNTGTIGILPAYPDPNVKSSASWFIYNLDLGKSKEDGLRVINNKNETAIIKLYAVDATITSDGSFALLAEDAPRNDVGGWVKLALNEVEVPPKSEKLIPFTISIPSSADVGDHAGGIVMQEIDKESQDISGTGVKIITRVGVRIYETVPGEMKRSFSFSRFDWMMEKDETANWFKKLIGADKKTLFLVGIKNEGNTKISPRIKVEIKNMFGQISGEVPESEIGVVFPRTETEDSMAIWKGMPYIGRYTAKITASFSEDLNEGTKELVIWAFPYRLAIELIFIFVLIILTRLILQYFKEIRKEKMPIYTTKTGDTLLALAETFGVKWKKLVRYNEIKKPYSIKDGQKIFIPINIEKYSNRDLLKKLYEQKLLEAPLDETENSEKKSRKKIIALSIISALIIMSGSVYYFKSKSPKKTAPPEAQKISEEEPKENNEKTKTGVIKKSSIKVAICSPINADPESNNRLQNKLNLIGYASFVSQNSCERNYGNTTIEYKPENKKQAEIVKNDIGISGQIDLVEIGNLSDGIIISNQADKNEFLQINGTSGKISSARDLIKIKLLKAGASNENLEKIKNLINNGGYTIEGDFEESKIQSSGLTIKYQTNEQQKNAENLQDFLKEQGQKAILSKTGNSSELIFLIMGK